MNDTQRMRNDIDKIEQTTITKRIDPYPSLESPFSKPIPLDNVSASAVWFVNDDGDFETNSFDSNDTLFFRFDYYEMLLKDISSLSLTFNIASDYPLTIEKIGIIDEIDTYTNVQIPVNGSSDVDISIDISKINNSAIVSLIEQSKFGVFVELSGSFLNGKIIISDINIVSEFERLLQDEIDAVMNRLQLADITLDTYSKEEIDSIVEGIVGNEIDLTGYVKTSELNTAIGTIENEISGKVGTADFNSALSGKQDSLVSGVNIKTVNQNSLLGSGDVSISVPSASATIPPADTTNGQYGSGSDYARSNHSHPKSSLYAEAVHTHKNLQKTVISSGSLDTVTTTGWYSYSTTNSANITNAPAQIGSVMEVLDDYGDGKYVIQKVYTLPTSKNPIIYYRQKYDQNGWGNWKRLTNADENSWLSYGQVDSTSTSTVFTATVPNITKLEDGVAVMLKNDGRVDSASGWTLNINGLGAKPVYSNMALATRETTIFNKNYTMLFVYDSTRVDGGCWICYHGYDSNTNTIGYQIRTNSTKFTAVDKGYKYRIWLETDDGKYMPINTSSSESANANKSSAMNTREFWLGGKILYNGYNGTTNANAQMVATTLWQQFTFNLGYSLNNTGSALDLTLNEPLYIVAEDRGNGKARLVTPYYTQTLPSVEDNKLYIYLGHMYSATNLELAQNHPVFQYKNNGIRVYRDYYTSSETNIELNKKENISNKITSWNATANHTSYPSEKLVKDEIDAINRMIGNAIYYINL